MLQPYDINEQNIELLASKIYNGNIWINEEFEKDLKRVKYIKRLLGKYLNNNDLNDNDLDELPSLWASINKLTNLEKLWLYNNNLNKVPPSIIKSHVSLRELWLDKDEPFIFKY